MKGNKKRILSAIISAAMLAASLTVTASAEQLDRIDYEADDNFENSAVTDGTLKNWDALNTATVSLADSDTEHGKSVKIAVAADAAEAFNGIKKTLSSAISESQYLDIDFDFKADADQIPAVYFSYSTTSGETTADSAIAMFFDNGNIYTGAAIADKISVGTYENPTSWHSAKIRVNGYNHTYNITIDGTVVTTNKIAGNTDAKSTGKVAADKRYKLARASVVGFTAEKGDECLFDNIAIKKIDRANYKPAQNFATDFEELKGDGEIPEGFENFNNSTFSEGYWSHVGAGTPEKNDENGTSLKLTPISGAGSGMVFTFPEAIKTGKLTIEYDAYVEATAIGNFQRVLYLFPANKDADGKYTGGIVGMQDNKGTWQLRTYSGTTAKNTSITKTELSDVAGKWIHDVLVIDFDKNTMNGSIDGETLTGTNNIHSTIKAGLGAIYFQNVSGNQGDKADGIVYIDNLKITRDANASEASFGDNFENYESLSDLTNAGWVKNGTVTDVEFPTDETRGGKVLHVKREATTSAQGLVRNMTPMISSGVITMKTSLMLDDEEMKTLIYMRNNGAVKSVPIVAFDTRAPGYAAVGMAGNLLGSTDSRIIATGIEAGTWYDVEAAIDVSHRLLSVTVKGTDGAEVGSLKNVPFDSLDSGKDFDNIASFRFQMQGANSEKSENANGASLDDVEITHATGTPSISNESVSLINYNGEIEADTTAAAPSVNKIIIDFGGPMNTASLLENVTLTKNSGEAVKFVGDNDTSRYTYTLSIPDMLEPNTTYTLSVPGATLSSGGAALDSADFEYVFTTGDGELTASFESIKVGGADAETKDGLFAGDIAEVTINYFNSRNTSNNLSLITGYYDADGMLVNAHYRKIPMDSSIKNLTVKYLEQIDNTAQGVNGVKMFLWNGLDFIYPLTANRNFE